MDISVAELLKCVHEGLEENEYGIFVYLDLREAFNMVNKDILLTKLYTLGIIG